MRWVTFTVRSTANDETTAKRRNTGETSEAFEHARRYPKQQSGTHARSRWTHGVAKLEILPSPRKRSIKEKENKK
jgi:hypothetical protein